MDVGWYWQTRVHVSGPLLGQPRNNGHSPGAPLTSYENLRRAIDRVRELHPQQHIGEEYFYKSLCGYCGHKSPCPTIAALDDVPPGDTGVALGWTQSGKPMERLDMAAMQGWPPVLALPEARGEDS